MLDYAPDVTARAGKALSYESAWVFGPGVQGQPLNAALLAGLATAFTPANTGTTAAPPSARRQMSSSFHAERIAGYCAAG